MPKLWSETLEQHRREVREAVIGATAALVGKHGVRGVTMQNVAKESGIGRATLYKYFPDLESILLAWHNQKIIQHLEQLAEVRDRTTDRDHRLSAVLHAYALIARQLEGHHDSDLDRLFHRDHNVGDARRRLHGMFRDLLSEAASAELIRNDIEPAELAAFCIRSLAAARDVSSTAGVQRLVSLVLDALRPQPRKHRS